MTVVINFYGGPGTGKSTSAAYTYALLKGRGDNAELVREYVKEWAWEGRRINAYDQLYFLGKQLRKESLLYGHVSHIVTDSPVLLGVFYARRYSPPAIARGVEAAAIAYYQQAAADGHHHYHVMLDRSKTYNPAGRYQSESEARALDGGIRDVLSELVALVVECKTGARDLEGLIHRIDAMEGLTP